MPIQVLIADDHQVVRDGLRLLLERAGLRVVGEAADGLAAVADAARLVPDVAVLDIALPQLNGLDAGREILKSSPKTKVVFLSMHADKQYILAALRMGAKGFVPKSRAADHLVKAIREAARGQILMTEEISAAAVEAYQTGRDPAADPLTLRERQVLQLIAEGNTTKQAAALLHISAKTAETHRSRAMEKLDIHETAGLVRYAIRRGLVRA